jgi:small-conductance mechanosensitive channel
MNELFPNSEVNQVVQESLQDLLALIPEMEVRVFATIGALLFLWLVNRIIDLVTRRLYSDVSTRYQARKLAKYVVAALGVLLIGRIWFDGFQTFTTFLGLISAGLVIALKDLLIDFAGWAFIVWRKPFHVGDRIEIGDIAGDVIDIRVFQFTLLEIGNWVAADQSTGRMIHVPNGKVFSEPQANYTQGLEYIWNEIPITITFESNWEKAKQILLEIATARTAHLSSAARERVRNAAQKYLIFYTKLTPIVYTSVKDHGIVLTIRYLSEPRRRRGSAEEIWEDVLRAFSACPDISFAFPTQRFYNQAVEGGVHPYPIASNGNPTSELPPRKPEAGAMNQSRSST